jgi:hypothetical protein
VTKTEKQSSVQSRRDGAEERRWEERREEERREEKRSGVEWRGGERREGHITVWTVDADSVGTATPPAFTCAQLPHPHALSERIDT